MGVEPKFGTESCPIELEAEDSQDTEPLSVKYKNRMFLLKPSPLHTHPSAHDSTAFDSPSPSPTGLEIVPYRKLSSPPPLASQLSPEDYLDNAEPGFEIAGFEEGPLTLDAIDDHADGSPAAPCSFKRLTKDHKAEHGNVTDVKLSQKTELEREMELFEAAEREEEARLLNSTRHNPSDDCSPSPKSPNSIENKQTNGRGSIQTLGEQPKPKRGRRAGLNHQALRKEEDVCFACFDGGQLILCDKRSCPKAYHMECTGRESEFFLEKGQWFCGWHVCNTCSKSANMHCYTCPNAYCSGCTKESEFICIRKGHGLCEMCYRIVYMIEHNLSIDSEGVEVNFDDEETYECLFRAYWKDLKEKLTLTWSEIDAAYRAKEEGQPLSKAVSEDDRVSTDSDCRPLARKSQRLKRKRVAKSFALEDASCSEYEEEKQEEEQDKYMEEEEEEEEESLSKPKRGRRKGREFIGWASKELVDFLHAIKEDSKKPLTLFALNKLLLRYVEANKLRPRYRGQIRCDERLQRLFGKKKMGELQMMKLLERHIASKWTASAKGGDNLSGIQDSVEVDNGDDKGQKQRKLKRKVDDVRHVEPDSFSYAAIDMKNISLIYLKRSLLEDLRGDSNFESKVTGAFVRIRVPSMVNKNDTCYRLVQIVGVKQTSNHRGKATNVILEILNLHKREEITVDLVSSQDFTEEECQRLKQSVKCGVLKAITVGELQEKARILQDAKVKDWLDMELVRLSHLRDRASEKGRRKELRECIERIQVLSSPSERERQLRAPIEVTSDPRMDPDYESEKAGNETKATQGIDNCLEPRFGKGQWGKNSFSVHHHNKGGWAEAAPHSDTREKVDQREPGKEHSDRLFGKSAQGWGYAKKSSDGWEEEGGFKQGSGWGGGSMQGDGWRVKKVASNMNGWGEGDGVEKGRVAGENSCKAKKENCETQAGDDMKDSGWGGKGSCEIVGNVAQNKSDDCWRENDIEGKRNDGWRSSAGVNSNADGWGHVEGGDCKEHGWGGNGDGKSKDDGWENNVRPHSKSDDGLGGYAGGNAKGDGRGGNAAAHRKDDGWGCSAGGNDIDDGWGPIAGGNGKVDGWGCRTGGNDIDNGRGPIAGGYGKGDEWGCRTGGDSKDDGWKRRTCGDSKDDGWRCRTGGHSKDDEWGRSTLGNSKDDGWGRSARGNSKDDGWRSNAFGNGKENGWGRSTGGNRNDDGWNGGASNKDNGWGRNTARGKDDDWGDNAGAHSKGDGWGGIAGAPGQDEGCGYHSGDNEKNVGWGPGNERRTGTGWGKPGGNRREYGWEVNANGVERNSGWKNGSTGFDRRKRYFGADSKPPYRETEVVDRTAGQTDFPSAEVRGAVPDVSTRLDVHGAGMAADNEKEKIWFYLDLRKAIQGPFSMEQLRKWETTKLFPLDLRIWRATEGQDASILLTDALLGRFSNDLPPGFAHHAQNPQSFSRPGPGAPDDMRNSPVASSSRSGGSWQDRGERSKWDQDNTGDSAGRPWRSHGSDRQFPRDGGRDGSRGHWDRGANYRGHFEHHHSHRPSNDGRFGTQKRDFPCRFFTNGICKKGDECDFRH